MDDESADLPQTQQGADHPSRLPGSPPAAPPMSAGLSPTSASQPPTPGPGRPRFAAPSTIQDPPPRPAMVTATARPRGFRADPSAPVGEPTAAPIGTTAASTAPDRHTRWRWAAFAAVGAVAILTIAVLAFQLGSVHTGKAATSAAATPTTTSSPTTLAATDLYRQLAPSVVVITTSKGALGTGFVVTAAGTVMTANHVVDDGGAIQVIFADGTKTTATVASADKSIDIATLTPAKLPEVVVPAALGGGVAVGADVIAIGNQLGLADSTTGGIVSGLDRTAKTEAGKLTGLIQFDAAVNPGSSGGPLIDNQGAVVGVVVSIADPGGDDSWSGIGFAVPIAGALGGADGDGPGDGPQL